jgi:hypothetical protein
LPLQRDIHEISLTRGKRPVRELHEQQFLDRLLKIPKLIKQVACRGEAYTFSGTVWREVTFNNQGPQNICSENREATPRISGHELSRI